MNLKLWGVKEMAKAAEITVDVKAKLSVDRKTAETCLRLLEIYVNENNVDIIGHRKEDGTQEFEFDNRTEFSKLLTPDAFGECVLR